MPDSRSETAPEHLWAAPGDITPAWLTAALRAASALQEGSVTQIAWERIGEGWGLTGTLARLHPRYAPMDGAEAAPSTLIAKLSSAPPQTDVARRAYERSAREIRFYQQIAPASAVPVPRLFYGAADEASGRVVLLLEDASAARAGDVLQGCSPDEASLVAQAIAPFHAQWWGRSRRAAFAWLPSWVGDPQARQQRYQQQTAPFLERFGQHLPDAVGDIVERLRFSYAAVLTRLAAAPQTLIHADLHLDNILFNPPGSYPPVVILDWQSICWGACVVDLALLVAGSLAPEQRRMAERDLFQRYHALLVEQGVSDYSLDHLREDYRLALLWNLAGTVGWLSSVNRATLAGRERALVDAALGDGRLIAALLDHEVAALLPR